MKTNQKQLPPELVEKIRDNLKWSDKGMTFNPAQEYVEKISKIAVDYSVDFAEEEKWKFIKSQLDFHKKQTEIYKRQAIHFKNDSQAYYLAGKQQSHHYHVCLYLEELLNTKKHEDGCR